MAVIMPAVTEYTLRRSPRARRVRVSVESDGEIHVTLPRRAPAGAAEEAVRELAPWIERRRRALARAAAELARTPGTVPYLGAELRLLPQPGRTRVHRRGDVLLVPATGHAGAPTRGDTRLVSATNHAAALERWYRRAARTEFGPRLDAAVARAGTAYTRLTIRGQRTRWASCSATGAMSFNWRLLLAPEAVLDYVIEHEVCHLEVMDHSPRFWRLLESRVPDWRAHARWLRRYGSTLVL
jgi:predicted metal-dependent hydrolase